MEFLTGFDVAIVVDAADFAERPVGEVRAWRFEELEPRAAGRLDSATTFLWPRPWAGASGRRKAPGEIWVVTIVARIDAVFGEELTPEVEAAIPIATDEVMRLLGLP